MNSTGNAFNRNPKRSHAPRHRSKGPVRDGPRSFLSAGSIRYERTLGRLKAAARDQGIHPDTVVMGGKATFAKWYCDLCGHQCVTSKDYQNHLNSQKHIEAIEEYSDGEILEMQSKLLEDAFIARLKAARTVNTKASILYEDITNAAKSASLEDTKWANEADPLTAFLEDMEREGKMLLFREENGIYIKYRPPSAPTAKATSLLYNDEELVSRQIKLAQDNERECSVPETDADVLERVEGAPKISFALAKKLDPKLGVQLAEDTKPVATNHHEAGSESDDDDEETEPMSKKSRGEKSSSQTSSKESSSSSRGGSSSSSISDSSGDSNRKKGSTSKSSQIVFKAAGAETGKSTVTAQCWLTRGLVVKCMCKATKRLGYYKQKGEIVDVLEYWKVDGAPSADIRMSDGVVLSKVPMQDLETVLPAIGRTVIIVQTSDSMLRGQEAELVAINEAAFSCTVRVSSGSRTGIKLDLPYEGICKVNT